MKTFQRAYLVIALLLISNLLFGQYSPEWTRNLTTIPDTSLMLPVKTITDASSNILVLSTYYKQLPGPSFINKILLNKFDPSGNLLWNFTFDNGGIGNPRGYDIATDNNDNIYIAGGLMNTPASPLLIKVSSSGTLAWDRDSTNSFNNSFLNQVIIKNNVIYTGGPAAVAAFDLNGNENWSHTISSNRIHIDHLGRMIVSANLSSSISLFRYNVDGTTDLMLSTISAERIATDLDNNIYLLTQMPHYELVKFDSSGNFQWNRIDFPLVPGFGDIGFELLVDFYNDILLAGLSDSIYKFRADGTKVWARSMQGMDSYMIDAKIVFSNILAITGTKSFTHGNYSQVAMYDLLGQRNYLGVYLPTTQQHFAVSLAIDNSGIYVLEDSLGNGSLLKYTSPFFQHPVDFDLICVDSVWYEPGNPSLINVRVFNGSLQHLNYPSVQIVSPVGDTIGNKSNVVNFFAHLGNYYQVYQDSITVSGISDFSSYTFVMHEGFGDTSAVIFMCATIGISEIEMNNFLIYPNPASDVLHISSDDPCEGCTVSLYSSDGKLLLVKSFSESKNLNLSVSELSNGLYILQITKGNSAGTFNFIKSR